LRNSRLEFCKRKVGQQLKMQHKQARREPEMSGASSQADVVIVGAGPVGLALAVSLRQNGVNVVILDRLAEGANTSRAAVVHARTMEVLEAIGLADEMLSHGLKMTVFRVRDRDKQLIEIDFKDIPSKYKFVLMIPQNETEALLLARLRSLGGDVTRPCEVTTIQQNSDFVTVTANQGGTQTEIAAKYVVGCDGMHSIVRQQAGIDFEGGSYEQSFVLADVTMDWPFGRDEVGLFLSSKGLAVIAPLPHDRFRIVVTVDNPPEHPTMGDVQELLDERGPREKCGHIQSLAGSSRFRVHHRVAETLRKGRVIIAGDAGHVHSPAGGQGMNTGIQDAVSLGEALSAALHEADTARLDEWERARHEIARRVVAMTDQMTKMATLQSHTAQTLRNVALSIAGHIPMFREAMAGNLAELKNR
jgi:2-polyprenyl-6-methoxyphenol hydroxylase-like FAD-dependent oxidoreductase